MKTIYSSSSILTKSALGKKSSHRSQFNRKKSESMESSGSYKSVRQKICKMESSLQLDLMKFFWLSILSRSKWKLLPASNELEQTILNAGARTAWNLYLL